MRGLRRLAALSASAVLLAMALGTPAPAAADPRPVTVRITIEKVNAIDCFEGETVAGCSGEADFYAVVSIDGVELPQSETIDDENNADPDPDWVFERVVDAGRGTVPVWIGVYDEDGGLRFDDDHADVSPVQGEDDKDLHLDVRVAPVCAATGDVTVPPEACGRTQTTDGDADEERARLFWRVEVIEPDTDGDWLPDSWEVGGLDADGDGVVDVDLPAMGADPLRRDLFLEIDCLVAAGSHSHCPIEDAVRTVVQALADAPVANTDGSFGIQLHVDIGDLYGHALGLDTKVPRVGGGAVGSYGNWGGGADRIPEAGDEIVDWDGMEGDPATSLYELKALYFAPERAYAFRYALSAHQVNARHPVNDCTGGWAEGGGVDAHGDPVAANDFIVSLGGLNDAGDPCWGTDAGGSSVGTWDQQAGVILHELGHTLGLGHGGGDAVNRKPNYLSVMNYAFGACSVPSIPGLLRGGCDFSRIALPTLEEILPPGLDECAGIGLGLGPVDWDGRDGLTGTTCSPASGNVSVNANGDFDDPNGNEIQDPGEEFIFGSLVGYEDWGRVAFGFRGTDYFANGSAPPPPDPMDPQAIATARAFLSDLAAPTLAVAATGPTDALPGDTLSYTVDLANTGRGPALGTVLVDTLPDGTSGLSSAIGTLPVGGTAGGAAGYAIPCSTGDGSVLTNTASASATDLVGEPATGSDVVLTTVHAPVIAVMKTATPAIGAGEAITYRLTYANTGTATATAVTVVDTLPASVYYSAGLDLGSGPRPDAVTPQADGTTTLVWNVGDVPGSSGDRTIEFTARPTLLASNGTMLMNGVAVTFSNPNGCAYAQATASAQTTISTPAPTRDPKSTGYWKTHAGAWTSETLARIQATDQRYDGIDGSAPDGVLAAPEMEAALGGPGGFPEMLARQLLGVYANLAERRIDAGTAIESKAASRLATPTVREAALYALETLLLPVTSATSDRYSAIEGVLDDVNSGRHLAY